ncbi:hypothetical protein BJX76DRAFT_335637 [Aspergillus varians]
MAEKSQTAPRSLPAPSAPADEVRAYIVQLLVEKHKTPLDVAEKHASKWEIGTFTQLSEASGDSLAAIFGPNVGMCLKSWVEDDVCEVMDSQPLVIFWKYATRITGFILVSLLVLLFLPDMGLQSPYTRITWVASPIPWYLFALSGVIYVSKNPTDQLRVLLLGVTAFSAFGVGFCLMITP